MKKDIHPQYHRGAKITCACGSKFAVGSTKDKISVELCSKCHPFYTGKQKLVDTARRVDKFKKKVAQQAAVAKVRKGKKAKKAVREAKRAKKEVKVKVTKIT